MTSMRIASRFALGALAVVLAACASISASADYDREVDFSRYRTYRFLSADPRKTASAPGIANPLMAQRVQRSIDRQLAGKGLAPAQDGEADLLIAHFIDVERRIDVDTYGYRYGRWYDHEVAVYHYKVATLVIDFIDARSKQMVWRGWATGEVRNQPEKADERVEEAVSKILAQYPPAAR